MKLTQTTPIKDVVEPVDLDYLRDHLRIDDNEQDSYLSALLQSARDTAEQFIDGIIADREFELKLDAFSSEIILPCRPVDPSTITISYVAQDETTQTVDSFDYKSTDFGTSIFPKVGESWPGTRRVSDAVTITFEAGFNAAKGEVPAAIKHAVVMIAATLYSLPQDHIPGGGLSAVPMSSKFLLQPFKKESF